MALRIKGSAISIERKAGRVIFVSAVLVLLGQCESVRGLANVLLGKLVCTAREESVKVEVAIVQQLPVRFF